MRCWNVLLLVCACNAKEPENEPVPKPGPVTMDSDEDETDSEEDEVPRDIPPQQTEDSTEEMDSDTGESHDASEDSGESSVASEDGDEPVDESPIDSGVAPEIVFDIDEGHRWTARYYPTIPFGEIRWETAHADGSRCLIEGLMADITEREESCTDCDFGIDFTLTGLAILLDEGACDRTLLSMEGSHMQFGHGHTQLHTEVDSDIFDLYRFNASGWESLESGFSFIEESDEFYAGTWVFGEEIDPTTGPDTAVLDGTDSSTP